MPPIKLIGSSTLGGGNDKGRELGKHEEIVEKRHEDEVTESLFGNLAKSFDAHHLDIEAAMALLELAGGPRIHAESSSMVTGDGVPLERNTLNSCANDTDGSRAAWSFAGPHMPDPDTVISTPFEDIQAATTLFSAHIDQGYPLAQRPDPNPMVTTSFEDTQAAVILFSIYLDLARSHRTPPG